MSFGLGYGAPYGGDALEESEDQQSPIAGLPFTFDFTDSPDGPFPGLWEFYNWQTDALGDVTVTAEADPFTYFRVANGLGQWVYTPQTSGGATDERGYAASPSGVLCGRNGRVSLLALQPVPLRDPDADEFVYEISVGLRFDPVGSSQPTYVGGRVRARWDSGTWADRMTVDAVSLDSTGNPTVLATAVLPLDPGQDPLDIWETQDNMELVVEVRDTLMTITMDGVVTVSAQVPSEGQASAVIQVKVYNRRGLFVQDVPVIKAVSFQSLRDFARLGPPPQLGGDIAQAAPIFPMIRLAIDDLVEAGFIQRVGARQFKVLQEFVSTVQSQSTRFQSGETIWVRENFVGQTLVAVTRDLAAQRGRSGL